MKKKVLYIICISLFMVISVNSCGFLYEQEETEDAQIEEPQTEEPGTVEPETVEPETVEPETVEPISLSSLSVEATQNVKVSWVVNNGSEETESQIKIYSKKTGESYTLLSSLGVTEEEYVHTPSDLGYEYTYKVEIEKEGNVLSTKESDSTSFVPYFESYESTGEVSYITYVEVGAVNNFIEILSSRIKREGDSLISYNYEGIKQSEIQIDDNKLMYNGLIFLEYPLEIGVNNTEVFTSLKVLGYELVTFGSGELVYCAKIEFPTEEIIMYIPNEEGFHYFSGYMLSGEEIEGVHFKVEEDVLSRKDTIVYSDTSVSVNNDQVTITWSTTGDAYLFSIHDGTEIHLTFMEDYAPDNVTIVESGDKRTFTVIFSVTGDIPASFTIVARNAESGETTTVSVN